MTLKPPSDWPRRGSIKFQNVILQYRKGLPDVLMGVSFSVQPGESLGTDTVCHITHIFKFQNEFKKCIIQNFESDVCSLGM